MCLIQEKQPVHKRRNVEKVVEYQVNSTVETSTVLCSLAVFQSCIQTTVSVLNL